MGKSVKLVRVVDANGGIGYQAGTGGAVTQATSKSTGVTLNKLSGQITMNAASLAANTTATFILTNSTIGANDVINIGIYNDVNSANYEAWAGVAAGAAQINLRNITAGALAEAVKLNFVVIKGVAA